MALTAVEEQEVAYFLSLFPACNQYDLNMRKAIVCWKRGESGYGIHRNNPLNITYFTGEPGFAGMSGGFTVFDNLKSGWAAAAYALKLFPNDFRKFGPVVAAIDRTDAVGFLHAIASSAWDAGHYGLPSTNRLISLYDNMGGFGTDTVYPGPVGSFPPIPVKPPAPVILEEPMDPNVIPDMVCRMKAGGTLYVRENGALKVIATNWASYNGDLLTYGVQPHSEPPRPPTSAALRAIRIQRTADPSTVEVAYYGNDLLIPGSLHPRV